MRMPKVLPIEEVRGLFSYDAASGLVEWKRRPVNDAHYDAIWNTRYAGTRAGTVSVHGYRVVSIGGRKYPVHRIAWAIHYGTWPAHDVDHVDGDKLNNRISNLRAATTAQNAWNAGKKKANTSGMKGVFWDKSRSKWLAAIGVNGKIKNLGRYSSKEDAAAAYADAARRYHGEFANTG